MDFFFPFFSLPLSSRVFPKQEKKKNKPCKTSLSSWCSYDSRISYSEAPYNYRGIILQSSPSIHLWPPEPFPLCPPHRRVTCTLPLTTKSEFPEDLLGCSSKESFRDHHLLEFASTSSLVYQKFYQTIKKPQESLYFQKVMLSSAQQFSMFLTCNCLALSLSCMHSLRNINLNKQTPDFLAEPNH